MQDGQPESLFLAHVYDTVPFGASLSTWRGFAEREHEGRDARGTMKSNGGKLNYIVSTPERGSCTSSTVSLPSPLQNGAHFVSHLVLACPDALLPPTPLLLT